jgi:apolipoprotein D and lipocalin family protein
MKQIFIILILNLALINPLYMESGYSLESRKLEVVSSLDLKKFQGTWYEIAHNPWFPEKGCFYMIANYKLTKENNIKVTNICRKNGMDGQISKVSGIAWLVDPKIKAKWEVQFIWPFTLDYWVIELEENYNYAVIGEPDRENLWILSRKPIMEKELLSRIIKNTKSKGYDLSNLILTPQDPINSTCMTQWIEEVDKNKGAPIC